MARVSPGRLQPALRASDDPLATDLVTLLDRTPSPPMAKATRSYPRREALRIYRRKAARGDRPSIRTDGYARLLDALAADPDGDVVVHGLSFSHAVYLVFTDPARTQCVGVLRKTRLAG